MRLYIKNMETTRCKLMVKAALANLQLPYISVEMGEANIEGALTQQQLTLLGEALNKLGFELVDEKRSALVEKVKTIVVEMMHYTNEQPRINFSAYISGKVGYDYNYLSNVFSEVAGTTIEQFIILQKIERVKQLLTNSNISLAKIAAIMQYSSAAHLANQFKKVTGITSSHFKKQQIKKRGNGDNVSG